MQQSQIREPVLDEAAPSSLGWRGRGRGPTTGVPGGPRRQRTGRHRLLLGAAWLTALAIPFLFLLFASVGPLIDQAVGSFFNWYDVHPVSFAGFHYYGQVLADPAATGALVHTAIYVAITVPIEVVLGLGGAWLVYRARRGRGALTTLFLLPLVIPWSSTATLFSGLLGATSGLDGLIDHVIGDTTPLVWDINPRLGFGVILFVGIWKGAPWCFLLMLAAFSTAPAELFEAGRMDGGRGLSYWRYVVIPTVLPMLVFVTIFRMFTEAQMAQSVDLLTQGGPFDATQLVGSYANDLAFMSLRFAESEALATATGAVTGRARPRPPLWPEAHRPNHAVRSAGAADGQVDVARRTGASERHKWRRGPVWCRRRRDAAAPAPTGRMGGLGRLARRLQAPDASARRRCALRRRRDRAHPADRGAPPGSAGPGLPAGLA